MSIVEWNEQTEKEVQDMIDEGITSFKLYMTYPAMIVNDCDLYKILKNWESAAALPEFTVKMPE